jgi:small subunit ribosomal protein S2
MADAALEGRAQVMGEIIGGEEFVEVDEEEGGVAAE